MNVEIGLPGQSREAIGRILNALLADEHVLYVKTRNYHWNVVGPQFRTLHLLFEEQYQKLALASDEIAERARALGVIAAGSMESFLDQARLHEDAGAPPEAHAMVANLMHDHEAVIQQLRKDVETCNEQHDDQGTTDFLTGLMEMHEKQSWMLRAQAEQR
ncbi:MAG: Dps family protein [Geminicoccaceae bacterium]